MKQPRKAKDLNNKEFEEQLLAALQSSDNEALDALLNISDDDPPLESEEPQESTIDDASLDTLELTYLNSDSDSQILMGNTGRVIIK